MASFVFGLIFLTAAMLCFGTSFLFYKKSKAYLAKAGKAEGTVKDLEKSGGVYYPIFEFQPPDGKPVTIKATTGSDPPSYKIGDKVDVVFDPKSPHEAKVNTIFQTYLESLISGALGALIFVIGLVFTVFF